LTVSYTRIPSLKREAYVTGEYGCAEINYREVGVSGDAVENSRVERD
jgi:hypothetical protein